ncbi:phosphatase [Embleya scabrispora]|uniref:Phosphatase n=1 Tax=Embleya scabrispora TaxID=159449 RepID=A0A1T3NLP7_9ACTN|nr:PP2C family protein-serine/threonine phosphatase [Embleya scabrispora]OPC77813.1 phosphatase [Embleya scabrispora]
MNGHEEVERALRAAPPHDLLDALRGVLTRHYRARTVDLLMADYGLTVLQPVSVLPHTTEPLSVHNSPQGRAFGAQEPLREEHEEGTVVHLPVSVRGDRLGVLTVTLPTGTCAPAIVTELADIAAMLAHAVTVAERDTDLYLQARRKDRLTLAAEMQWQLLPGRACSRAEYAIGAQLEPAYAVRGDNFDWSATADHLVLTVTNGMGEGIDAALLSNLTINALRNARRAGVPIADQAALADQAVFAQYRGEAYLSVLLLDFELATGRVTVVDAGSPRLLALREGTVTAVDFDAQLPLGMFEETDYKAQEFRVRPGDRLVFVSDGVHAVASPAGEAYGDRALARAISATRLLPPAEMPRAVLRELTGHRGRPIPDDDALIVCLDWYGRPTTDRPTTEDPDPRRNRPSFPETPPRDPR